MLYSHSRLIHLLVSHLQIDLFTTPISSRVERLGSKSCDFEVALSWARVSVARVILIGEVGKGTPWLFEGRAW